MAALARLLAEPPLPPLGSPQNPIVVPPALYDAIKADPRWSNVSTKPNLPLPFSATIVVRDDD